MTGRDSRGQRAKFIPEELIKANGTSTTQREQK